ncbi:MAG: hypothetical protein JWP87_4136 [Labilithrix sp.]|nr:hypothetical protein [Labilithrix sp.]
MRIRPFLVLVSIGLVASGLAIQACGSTVNDDTPVDAGTDAFEASAAKDVNQPDVKDAAPPCDPNKDYLKDIPDASLADGATTTGACLSCANAKCKAEISACAKDCACQNLAGDAIGCYLKGGSILSCGSGFASVPTATRNIGIALFGCLNQQCPDECATSQFDPDAGDGGDGG